jgi:hypothetical protein
LRDVVKDTDGTTLRTCKDARDYMITAMPDSRAMGAQWQAAARLLLDGADAEPLTRAIELALMYEPRLDVRNDDRRSVIAG